MTIVGLRRKWLRLIRQVEREERKKFKRKPSLKLHDGRPRSEQVRYRKNGRVTKVAMSRVVLSRRMCRDREALAVLTAKHELRELLHEQHGVSRTKAHRLAVKREKSDRKRLGLTKSYGWLAREFWKR